MAVNFSLYDFSKLATGKYNAGYIDYTTDDTKPDGFKLIKINNHVHNTDQNMVKMTPEHIIEVKEAFLNALSDAGVKGENFSEIRKQLGLPEEIDLHEKFHTEGSIQAQEDFLVNRYSPLSRAQVRAIIDHYVGYRAGGPEDAKLIVTAAELKAIKNTAKTQARKDIAAIVNLVAKVQTESYDFAITHALYVLAGKHKLSAVDKVRNDSASTPAESKLKSENLRSMFKEIFRNALKLQGDGVREGDMMNICGIKCRYVLDANDKVVVRFGDGKLAADMELGFSARDLLENVIGRAVNDMVFLDEMGGAKNLSAMLDGIFNHDIDCFLAANDRESLSRRFASALLAKRIGGANGFDENLYKELCSGEFGNFNTQFLVDLSTKALDEDVELTRENLQDYEKELSRNVAELPQDIKDKLAELVRDNPIENLADKGEFKISVKEAIVADLNEIAKGNVPPPAPEEAKALAPAVPLPPPRAPDPVHRSATPDDVKNFVSNLVFSDATLVGDAVIDKPGALMRKILTADDRSAGILADILRFPWLIDQALSPKIAADVKAFFTQMAERLDADFKAAYGKSLKDVQSGSYADYVAKFCAFIEDESKCKGTTLDRFNRDIDSMVRSGCEKIQTFINETFKITGEVKNEAGGLTDEPYRNKSAKEIKAELDKKSLDDIIKSSRTDASVPGQVGFFKEILRTYFTEMTKADKRCVFASAMRYADTFDFGGLTGDALTSKSRAATDKFVGAILKGTGPLLQKLMQGIPQEALGEYTSALEDMKSNLSRIPVKIVQAQLYDIIARSKGTDREIQSINLLRSLGAASVAEALECEFTYKGEDGKAVSERVVVKIMRHDAERRMEREAKLFEAAAKKVGGGMVATWEGQYQQYKTEFDFRNEERNINEGAELYSIRGHRKHPMYAVASHVGSMKVSKLGKTTKDVLVCTYAGPTNADKYFKETTEAYRSYGRQVVETDPATGRLKWDKGGKPLLKKGAGFNEQAVALMGMYMNAEQLKAAHKMLCEASRLWFHEAILGSGKFHGDAHAGNIMLSIDNATFIDYGNLYRLQAEHPYTETVEQKNEKGEMVKVQVQKNCDERQELLRLILGATLRKSNLFIKAFERLVSDEGRAKLDANREKVEAILSSILAKGKFSFDACYRLQGALTELQKLGLELPPQINCFVQSMMRLQNTLAQMNTIINQTHTISDALMNPAERLPPDAPKPDELDLLGRIDYLRKTDEGNKPVQALDDVGSSIFMKDEDGYDTETPVNIPKWAAEIQNIVMHDSLNDDVYGEQYANKAIDRLKTVENPVAEAERLVGLVKKQIEGNDSFGQHVSQFEKFAADFKEKYDASKPATAPANMKAIKTFARNYCENSVRLVRMRMDAVRMLCNDEPPPTGFTGLMMQTLFSGSDQAKTMINSFGEDKMTIQLAVRAGAVEAGAGVLTFSQDKLLAAIAKDARSLGGDGSYSIDIGL